MEKSWPGDQSTNAVETKTPDEDSFVAEMAEDPIRVAERGERVGSCDDGQFHGESTGNFRLAKSSGLKTSGTSFGYAYCGLELLFKVSSNPYENP